VRGLGDSNVFVCEFSSYGGFLPDWRWRWMADARHRRASPLSGIDRKTRYPDGMPKLPAMVSNELVLLSQQQQIAFREEYERRSKSMTVCYLAWLLLGWHYAYLRKWGVQVLYWVTAGGFLIWMFIDLFRVPSLVRNYNKDVGVVVMRDLRTISR